jgi:hypothetical protein
MKDFQTLAKDFSKVQRFDKGLNKGLKALSGLFIEPWH